MQQRLTEVTDRCTEILNRWTATDDRHAHAIAEVEGRLGEWAAIENRLQQESVQRIRELEQKIEHEWQALRQIHEAPAQQLREQAAALGETCVAAANLALRGFERAEARFAALETDLQDRLGQLSRDVQAALAEMKRESGRRNALGTGIEPFPLDGVMRIHEELREAGAGGPVDSAPRQLPARIEIPPQTIDHPHPEDAAPPSAEGLRRYAVVLAGSALAIVLVAGLFVQRQLSARLDVATSRAAAAERQSQAATDAAAKQIATTRAEADRQIAEARQTALKAEIVSNVLAAPDLIRFNLVGFGDAQRAYAQILFSRTRGLVLSGARLPIPANGATYQLWLLTDAAPVSAGLLVPDSSGRVSLATDATPNIPRRITGSVITLEPPGGGSSPSGITVLGRAPGGTTPG